MSQQSRSRENSWNVNTSLPLAYSLVAAVELADIADEGHEIVVMTPDLMTSNRTQEFADRHPDRFFNVGIAEQNMVSMAAGLASCGYRVFVATYASFVGLLCFEQIRTDLAANRLPVTILAHHAGVALGFYGTSHHAIEDIAAMRAIPGLVVANASDANSTRGILRATLDHPGPVYLRLGRGREQPVHEGEDGFSLGLSKTLRNGSDATIFAIGVGVQASLDAAHTLSEQEGIEVVVIDAVYLKPFDKASVLEAARRGGPILSVEEHNVVGGLGGAIAEVLAEHGVPVAFARHGIQDSFTPVAPPTHLYRELGLSGPGVHSAILNLFDRTGKDPLVSLP